RGRRAGRGDAARRPRRSGERLSDAAGHHTRPHDSGAPRVHTVLRMPAGSFARVAGYTIAGRCRLRERGLPRDRCDRGRVGHLLCEGASVAGGLLRVHQIWPTTTRSVARRGQECESDNSSARSGRTWMATTDRVARTLTGKLDAVDEAEDRTLRA